MSRLNADQILRQVRSEWARRRGGVPVAGDGESSGETDLELWFGAMPDLPVKPAYALHELLAFSDRAFIRNAYAVILRRGPDHAGMEFFLQKLRCGLLGKVEVLAALRWSEEGRARGVHVDGLLVPYVVQTWKRKRFVGGVVAWLHGLLNLGSLPSRLAAQESAQAREINELGAHANQMQVRTSGMFDQLLHVLTPLDGRLTEIEQRVTVQARSLLFLREEQASATSESNQLRERFDHLAATLDDHLQTVGATRTRLEEVGEYLASLVNRIGVHDALRERDSAQLEELDDNMGLLANRVDVHDRLRESDSARMDKEVQTARALDSLYVAFEQQFRGSSELIRARMAPYVDILREANVGAADHPVLDVGCGNGDWLDVLRDGGFSARGVDSNRLFVELCRGRGLDVVEGDALEYLEGLPDGSLGAVTGLHIAEHLPFETLVRLIDECRRVLCIGGVIALETPNPEHLLVASNYFYNDPTHRNPLPPDTLCWLVEARGFQRCRIERWRVARDMSPPPLLDESVPGAASMNALLVHLHAAPDYAVIGRRL